MKRFIITPKIKITLKDFDLECLLKEIENSQLKKIQDTVDVIHVCISPYLD